MNSYGNESERLATPNSSQPSVGIHVESTTARAVRQPFEDVIRAVEPGVRMKHVHYIFSHYGKDRRSLKQAEYLAQEISRRMPRPHKITAWHKDNCYALILTCGEFGDEYEFTIYHIPEEATSHV